MLSNIYGIDKRSTSFNNLRTIYIAMQLSTLSNGDLQALSLTIQAAQILDKLFLEQVSAILNVHLLLFGRATNLHVFVYLRERERERERKKERYINVFKRPKWPIRRNKRLHLKCFLVFENTSK